MKGESLNFTVTVDVYNYDLMVSFGETDKELVNRFIKNGYLKETIGDISYSSDNSFGCFITTHTGAGCIRLRKIPKNPFEYGCLAHEIFHSVEYLMCAVGVIHNKEYSGESYAYAIQYITEQIYKKTQKC